MNCNFRVYISNNIVGKDFKEIVGKDFKENKNKKKMGKDKPLVAKYFR